LGTKSSNKKNGGHREIFLQVDQLQAVCEQHVSDKAKLRAACEQLIFENKRLQAECEEHIFDKEKLQAACEQHISEKEELQAACEKHISSKEELQAVCEQHASDKERLADELKTVLLREAQDAAALRQTVSDTLAAQDSIYKRQVRPQCWNLCRALCVGFSSTAC
jgi:hypothetical protein